MRRQTTEVSNFARLVALTRMIVRAESNHEWAYAESLRDERSRIDADIEAGLLVHVEVAL